MTKTAKKPHGQTRALKHFAKPAPEPDRLENARQQGQAQFNSIMEMVEALGKAEEDDSGSMHDDDSARQTIQEDALSVQVRSGWYQPGADSEDTAAAEYEILLCTGGPACRIIGELGRYGEPESARLEVQDWFTPWTPMRPLVAPNNYDSEPVLLAYARCFYFGEG